MLNIFGADKLLIKMENPFGSITLLQPWISFSLRELMGLFSEFSTAVLWRKILNLYSKSLYIEYFDKKNPGQVALAIFLHACTRTWNGK